MTDLVRYVAPAPLAWRPPAPVVTAALAAGLLFDGFDSAAGQAWNCIVNAILLMILLVGEPVPAGWWRRAAPVLGWGALAMGWGVFATMRRDGTLPDYAPGAILSLVCGWSALLAGAVVAGRDRRGRGALLDWLLAWIALDLLVGLALRAVDGGLFDYWTVMRDGRFQGTVGNVNVTATMAGVGAILAGHRLASAIEAERRDRMTTLRLLGFAAALLLCGGVLVLTASRVPALLVVLILAVGAWPVLRRGHWRPQRWQWVVAATLVLVAATLFLLRSAALLQTRFGESGAGWRDRTGMWVHYAGLAGDRPLTGYGLGAFPSVNTHFLTDPRFAQATWANNSPHNVLLQLLLGAGLPYAVATVTAVALAAVAVMRSVPRGGDNAAILAALALIVGCSMVDVVLDMPASLNVALFLAGLLWGQALTGVRNPRRRAGSRSSLP